MAGVKDTTVTQTVTEPEVATSLDAFDLDPEAAQEIQGLLKDVVVEPEPAKTPEATKTEKGLKTAVVQERQKRRTATERWQQVEAERQKLQSQLNLRTRPAVSPGDFALEFSLTPDELRGITEEADKAESFGQVAHITATAVAKAMGAKAKKQVGDALGKISKETNDALFSIRMDGLERLARIRNKDYDQMVQTSGIMAGLQIDTRTGKAVDEALARQVFGSDDPAEALYEMAKGKLISEGKLEDEGGDDPIGGVDDEPIKKQPVAVVPKNVKEAQQQIIDRVLKNGQRPRGISDVPAATPARNSGITRQQIDMLADDNPAAYSKLMAERPSLRQWYLGG